MLKIISQNKKIALLGFFFALAGGVFVRAQFSYWHYLETSNVNSYYLSKTVLTEENGRFPQTDSLDRAGDPYSENAPPLLAYATVISYRLLSVWGAPITITDFAKVFPVLIFLIWAAAGIFAIKRLCPGIRARAIFIFLMAFLPATVELTRIGSYFEEILGAALFFFALLAFLRIESSWRTTLYGAMLLTALALTWQQFPVFYAGAGAAVLFEVIVSRRRSKKFLLHALVFLSVPLLLGEIISRFFLHISYTPIGMLRELFLGISVQNDPAVSWVMRRTDWRNFGVYDFFKAFGAVGIFFAGAGLLAALWRMFFERNARILFIFGALAFVLPVFFIKERFLSLAIMLILGAYGAEFIFSGGAAECFHSYRQSLLRFLRVIQSYIQSPRVVWTAFAVMLLLISLALFNRESAQVQPRPVISVTGIPQTWKIGKTYTLKIRLTNAGGSSLKQVNAFGGVHVEVENAFVRSVREQSLATKPATVFKKYSSWGNIFFFETKFPRLKENEEGEVSFEVIPYWLPVRIYSRGWLPDVCPRETGSGVLKDLLPAWQTDSNIWRSENCIKRTPALDEFATPLCKIPVLAAHKDPPPFRCFVN